MDAWKNAFILQENHVHKIRGGGECRFYFYGREDFYDCKERDINDRDMTSQKFTNRRLSPKVHGIVCHVVAVAISSAFKKTLPSHLLDGLVIRNESRRFARIGSQANPPPSHFHNVRAIRANRLKPAICNSWCSATRKLKVVQFGNPALIRANQEVRANLQIDTRESGHLSPISFAFVRWSCFWPLSRLWT